MLRNGDQFKDTTKRTILYSDYSFVNSLWRGATTRTRAHRASEADMARARAPKVGLCISVFKFLLLPYEVRVGQVLYNNFQYVRFYLFLVAMQIRYTFQSSERQLLNECAVHVSVIEKLQNSWSQNSYTLCVLFIICVHFIFM